MVFILRRVTTHQLRHEKTLGVLSLQCLIVEWARVMHQDRESLSCSISWLLLVNISPNWLITENDFLTDCRKWLTWLDEFKWLWTIRTTGLFSCPLFFFTRSFLSSYLLPLFHFLISILLFPCASVRENTLAWFHFFHSHTEWNLLFLK